MKNKLIQFMRGRYGVDLLSKHLYFVSLGFLLLSFLLRMPSLNSISLVLIFYVIYRNFSKKLNRRYQESQQYIFFRNKMKRKFNKLKSNKDYKYLTCPSCGKETRVPRKKGKIVVTCPSCKHKFDAKS